ncbi:Rhamnogalacturonyl hydrolase YesR [Draconibacterium orientale]|uniref:Glucuronyl hydrolase n=1 Tax=Draconibacterium orientale TaxID=1168034 RepID=X5DHM6_9BACT|nr:glycoside hydrolase family 88 protein [Draconibacterium orientale]AHW60594.1 glucuronyl hydrolase [Draconibacterium orientale]SET04457.1 Rhamnogalacturonyl hydrolase YesR [Draconibacterium orientale]
MNSRVLFAFCLGAIILSSCLTKSTKEKAYQPDLWSELQDQEYILVNNVDEFLKHSTERGEMAPRSLTPEGDLDMVPSSNWCSGFFAGCMWLMYEQSNDPKWKEKAEEYTALLADQQYNGNTHDMGFKIFNSYGQGYRLTHNPEYRDVLVQSAQTLITRFNPTIGCIRSWDHNQDKWQFPVIIDNMMNLELLFWATHETGDSVFYNIAVSHALTTLENHFRDDYSCYHVVDYDSETGKAVAHATHQGFSDASAWSRGQAWALYGYTMVYRETENPVFLEQAKHIASYILSHPNLPEDLIPYWDFDAPQIPNEPRDVSAAAIIASALLELKNYVPEEKNYYEEKALLILSNLTEKYRSPKGRNYGFLLTHSTGSKPHDSEVNVPIVYADYYYLESLIRNVYQ